MFRPTTIVMPIALMAFAIVSFLTLIDYSVNTHLQSGQPVTNVTACTDEAKLCPDGSAVGRTGPNCEFAACPTEVNVNAGNRNIQNSQLSMTCQTDQDCYAPCPGTCFNTSYTGPLPDCMYDPPSTTTTNTSTCSCLSGKCSLKSNNNLNSDNEIVCAADVQSCSDGSYVQRVPPTCEFADCPAGTEPISPSL